MFASGGNINNEIINLDSSLTFIQLLGEPEHVSAMDIGGLKVSISIVSSDALAFTTETVEKLLYRQIYQVCIIGTKKHLQPSIIYALHLPKGALND